HVYVSSESSGIEKLTDFLNSSTNFVKALTSLGSLVFKVALASSAVAGVFVGVAEPVGPSGPEHCLFIADQDSLIDAANELFWKDYPELNRRLIRKGETEYEQEWLTYYKQAEECLKDGQL
ncbi:MAG: hypothetical protein ACFB2W_26850, partial [Leptolyngbyaceae cyanobacterium]